MTGQELAPRAADGETTCQAETPAATGLDWYCVAASGHDGDHVAWAFGAAGHTWPQAGPASDTITSDVGTLRPAENMALTVARAQLDRGENPPRNITAMLLATVERLAGIRDYDDPADGA
jgi:hypothetical protein